MNNSYLAPKHFLMIAGLLLTTSTAQAALPLVVIKSYGQHIGGNIIYQYQVINNSACRIPKFAIGLDTDYINSQLPSTRSQGEFGQVLPLGFEHYYDEGMPGSYDASSFSGPTNWRAEMTRIEESGAYLEWTSDNAIDPSIPEGQDIFPGQTVRFSVTTPKVDTIYVKGHFSAELGLGGTCPDNYNDVMQNLDTTPPVLTVTLTPATITAAQRGLMIPVTATITVKDDYDPAPEIKLVSVLADDPANGIDIQGDAVDTDDRSFSVRAARFNPAIARTYQVIYSATDASGNTSTATVNLLVN